MKNLVWTAILFVVLLTGCEKPEVVQDEYHDFKIEQVVAKTPVHIWVHVIQLESGKTYKINTGKSCKRSDLQPVGTVVRLRQVTYAYRSNYNSENAWSSEMWPDRRNLCNL